MYYACAMTTTRKRASIFWIIGIVVLLLVAAGAFWWATTHSGKVTKPNDTITKALGTSAEAQNLRAIATQNYVAKKDMTGGLNYYDELIARTTNTEDKRKLLLDEAQFATTMKHYDEAIARVKQAEAIKKDTSSVLRMAQIYEQKGDKKAAIAAYNEAIAMASADTTGFSARYSYQWKQKIEGLSK